MLNSAQLNRLEKLAELRRIGALTDEEFEQEKAKILAGEWAGGGAGSDGTYSQSFHIPTQPGSFAEWLVMPLNRYADFNGRSSRKEYWLFSLTVGIIITFLASEMIGGFEADSPSSAILFASMLGLFSIAVLVPLLAVQVRRFHDQDRSGWLSLLNIIPYVGPIIVFVFMLVDGTPGENRFGPDSKVA